MRAVDRRLDILAKPPRRAERCQERPRRDQKSRGDGHQADVPTQEALPAQDARLSCAYGNAGRATGAEVAAAKGPQAPHTDRAALTRRHRLRGRSRFAALRRSGLDVRQGGLRLRASANELDYARVGFAIIGARSAVERNRLRRRLRAAAGPGLGEWPGTDILIAVPGAWVCRPFKEIVDELERAFARGKRRTMELQP